MYAYFLVAVLAGLMVLNDGVEKTIELSTFN
jgi:hypothetical protein